jgi:hypothetical protein
MEFDGIFQETSRFVEIWTISFCLHLVSFNILLQVSCYGDHFEVC